MHDDDYADEPFEEEDEAKSPVGGHELKAISFEEVELGEQLSGGGVGLIHCGKYLGERVAIKTMVRFRTALLYYILGRHHSHCRTNLWVPFQSQSMYGGKGLSKVHEHLINRTGTKKKT